MVHMCITCSWYTYTLTESVCWYIRYVLILSMSNRIICFGVAFNYYYGLVF